MMLNEMQSLGVAVLDKTATNTFAGSEEDKALLASLIVQQEAFYMGQADYFRAFFEKMGKPVVMHVTVGDEGIYVGYIEVKGRFFALLENPSFGFYIVPAQHCYDPDPEDKQWMRVILDKSSEGPCLAALPLSARKPIFFGSVLNKREKEVMLADLMAEQHAFFNRYQEEFVRVFRQTGKNITYPVTAGDRGRYAGEVEIGARVFALLEHRSGHFYIVPAQNCHHTRDKQAMRVILYQSDCNAFYWLIAVVDKPTAEDGLLADFNMGQSKPMERDKVRGIQQDWDKGMESGMEKTASLPKPEVSKKKPEIEKERDFEMEM